MATITPKVPTIAGVAAPFAATAVAGDQVEYSGGDLVIEFNNGHSADITVNIAPTKTTGLIQGAGVAPVPTRTLLVEDGTQAVIRFKASEIKAYLNANKRVPITYTGGNIAMTMRAFLVK